MVLEKGLKFVLVAPWGELDDEGKQLKKPIHKNYQKQRFGPGFQSVKDHIDRNGLLGVIPESYRCGGIDVDRGDATAIITEFPPLLVTQSQRPGGLAPVVSEPDRVATAHQEMDRHDRRGWR